MNHYLSRFLFNFSMVLQRATKLWVFVYMVYCPLGSKILCRIFKGRSSWESDLPITMFGQLNMGQIYPICYNWNYYFYKNISKEKINRLFSMWKTTTRSLLKNILFQIQSYFHPAYNYKPHIISFSCMIYLFLQKLMAPSYI